MYQVYFLKSENGQHFYIGCTSDLVKRLKDHNAGKNRSTKPFRPWHVVYSEDFTEKTDAFKREWFLKHPRGYKEKCVIIKKYGGVA